MWPAVGEPDQPGDAQEGQLGADVEQVFGIDRQYDQRRSGQRTETQRAAAEPGGDAGDQHQNRRPDHRRAHVDHDRVEQRDRGDGCHGPAARDSRSPHDPEQGARQNADVQARDAEDVDRAGGEKGLVSPGVDSSRSPSSTAAANSAVAGSVSF